MDGLDFLVLGGTAVVLGTIGMYARVLYGIYNEARESNKRRNSLLESDYIFGDFRSEHRVQIKT